MATQKPIMVTERTHEIIRREALNMSVENPSGRTKSMGDLIREFGEKIQAERNYIKLPEVTK